MKRCLSLLLALFLFVPLCAGQSEESGNAVLGGKLSHEDRPEVDAADSAFIQQPLALEYCSMVVGSDDRVRVDPKEYPYCAIAYIIAEAYCGCSWSGTGFLVGPSGVVTAGHCLHCGKHDSALKNITLYFGFKSFDSYLYKYTNKTTYWYNDSRNETGEEFDYGYIKLQERVGDQMGWFGVWAKPDKDVDGKLFYAAGFRSGLLKKDLDWVYVDNPYRVSHTIDMEPGYSGCPIYDSNYNAIAINVSYLESKNLNFGCRFTDWLVVCMRADGIFD